MRGIHVILILALVACCKTVTLEEIRTVMKTQLNRGDSEEKVLAFMARNGIESYGPHEYRKYLYGNFRDSMDRRWKDIDNYPISYYYAGTIRDAERGCLVSCGIYMRFYFDDKKKLQGQVSNKICTGF